MVTFLSASASVPSGDFYAKNSFRNPQKDNEIYIYQRRCSHSIVGSASTYLSCLAEVSRLHYVKYWEGCRQRSQFLINSMHYHDLTRNTTTLRISFHHLLLSVLLVHSNGWANVHSYLDKGSEFHRSILDRRARSIKGKLDIHIL